MEEAATNHGNQDNASVSSGEISEDDFEAVDDLTNEVPTLVDQAAHSDNDDDEDEEEGPDLRGLSKIDDGWGYGRSKGKKVIVVNNQYELVVEGCKEIEVILKQCYRAKIGKELGRAMKSVEHCESLVQEQRNAEQFLPQLHKKSKQNS